MQGECQCLSRDGRRADRRSRTAGADVDAPAFEPVEREDLAGLPAGPHLEEYLAAGEPRLAMHLPAGDVPLLTYLRRDLAAGWRGYG